MARRAHGRTLSRHSESPRISLAGPERRAFLRRAGFCVLAAAVPAAAGLRPPFARGDVAFLVGWAALMVAVAAYYVRIAYGWVHIDPVGLRTSRLWRGRHLRWAEIGALETKTWRGKAGGITLVKAHTWSGRTYYLPAPRTTSPETAEAFHRQLRQLMRHVPGY
jgi:hypothetical protein